MKPVGVVGVGMVGGTIAHAFGAAGVGVRRYDANQQVGDPADLAGCDVVFLCVPTPRGEDEGYDLKEVLAAIGTIEAHLHDGTIIAVKSTVPPGTNDRLAEAYPRIAFVSTPEFLVAGRPLETFSRPDRMVIGCRSLPAGTAVAEVLTRVAPAAPILFLRPIEAELVKLCSNAMLSAKVALANELFEVCRTFGVDWSRVESAVGLDRRIGPDHLTVHAERGFGGSCLPKDLDGLMTASYEAGYEPVVLRRIAEFNRKIREEAKPETVQPAPLIPSTVGLNLRHRVGPPVEPTETVRSSNNGAIPRSHTDAAGVPALVPSRRGEAARFLFYSHDGLGLGHVRRNLTIASALQDIAPRASVLIATSVDESQRMGLPPNVDIVKLPGIRKLDNEHYAARRLEVPWNDVREVRAQLLEATVESFRPAVLLVDRHPLGVGGELLPALERAKAVGSRAVLGLRDVLDDPATVRAEWTSGALFDRIPEYYDRVLVYGQPDVYDPVREYGFPARVATMTSFCGYVFRPAVTQNRGEDVRSPLGDGARRRPVVLGTAGGGEDGFALLERFLEAASGAPWEAMVVTGPQCHEEDRRRLLELAAEAGVEYRTFVPGLASYFASTDALVCMGGYNTLLEAVASAAPTVCVPRARPRTEQLIRAEAFARLGLVSLIDPDRVGASVLRAEIESALCVSRDDLARRVRAVLDLNGARRTACHLLDVATGSAGAPEAIRQVSAG